MTDYETLAALGFTEPAAKTSEHAVSARPDGISTAHASGELPSRRTLRAAAQAHVADLPSTPSTPALPGSRRAAREARESAAPVLPAAAVPSVAASIAASPSAVPTAPQVAAPFGIFEAPSAEHATRRSQREHVASSRPASRPAADAAPRTPSASAPSRGGTTRKRLSAAGTMVLVGGLFVSLTLPAYASNDYSGGELAEPAAAKIGAQTLPLDESAIAAASSVEARDGYDSTSAVELRRLYRDALRQQRLEEYLASGAMAMGDDYPWAAELGMAEGGGLSPLNYFVRQCTDFVAWRLNRDAGSTKAPFKYTWSYLTPGGGSAHSWKSQWERHGWAVSSTPAPGWVAWFPGGNHVAYVNSVLPDGSVFIEEYNWGPDTYNQRIIPAGSALYLAPPPA
ncbi:MAG: CHAP domain-containing protein [Protaetiibacter sp.]